MQKYFRVQIHCGYKYGVGYLDESACASYFCDIGYSLDKESNEWVPDYISDIFEIKCIYQSNCKNEFTADHQTSYGFIAI